LAPTTGLYRLHRAAHSPWYFADSGEGRFDLRDGQGTCYLALEAVVAFIEVFYGLAIVPSEELLAYAVSTVRVATPVRLADCTSPRAAAFGVTGEIHTSVDYELTRRWAEAWRLADFGGIRYWARHDPGRGRSVAIFGPSGARTGDVAHAGPVDRALQVAVTRRYGVTFLSTDLPP
jgi:hypothetical protein